MTKEQIQKELDYSMSMCGLYMLYGNKENEEKWEKRIEELKAQLLNN